MLSDKGLIGLMRKKKLLIKPFSKKSMGCASIDLSLGKYFARYNKLIDTRKCCIEPVQFESKRLILAPNQFVLGITHEQVALSNGYYGFIETRGNFARAGISVTCADGHIDPGTNGRITLEIKNNNNVGVVLYPGDFICQLFVFRLSSNCRKVYVGRYKGQKFPTGFLR